MSVSDCSLTISSFALQSLLYEVSCSPSPGLVSPVSNGAHKDMNYFTFIDSTSVLSKYFALFAEVGLSKKNCQAIFGEIRTIGREAEESMFIKTNGINTHKGMLFLIGIACAAVGKVLYEKKDFSEVQDIIKEMTSGIVEKELVTVKESNNLSHGEKIYLKYQNDGVRGEVERGIPIVFDYSLELFKQNSDLSMNDRLVHTLIGIMTKCNDSTIIHRHEIETLEKVKKRAKEIMEIGGMRSVEGRAQIDNLCKAFEQENISAGGSADLLGATVFFYLVEQYMNEIYD